MSCMSAIFALRNDQYAFRPTGSTSAATIAILQSVTDLLSSNQYVIVLALDFSKAFDTIRQDTLLNKMDFLDIPMRSITGSWTSSQTTVTARGTEEPHLQCWTSRHHRLLQLLNLPYYKRVV